MQINTTGTEIDPEQPPILAPHQHKIDNEKNAAKISLAFHFLTFIFKILICGLGLVYVCAFEGAWLVHWCGWDEQIFAQMACR